MDVISGRKEFKLKVHNQCVCVRKYVYILIAIPSSVCKSPEGQVHIRRGIG